jgi:hypothetical protein
MQGSKSMALIFTQLAAYSFARANVSPIDPAFWSTITPASPDPEFEPLSVVSNQCVCLTSAANSNPGGAQFNGVVLPNDQYVEFKVTTVTAMGFVGAGLRSDITSQVGYETLITGPLGPNTTIQLDNVGPNGGELATTTTTINSGDVIRLAAIGSSLSVYVNGAQILSAVDSEFTSGTTFIELIDEADQNDVKIASYAVGSVSGNMTSPTVGSIFPGSYPGASLAVAFTNPQRLDLLQVVNEGGNVVWSLSASGVASTNPTSPTRTAVLGQFEGSSFATAFPNPGRFDILQIVKPGSGVVFHVDYLGNANTP